MTPLAALEAIRDALLASLVKTDVYIGHIDFTPQRQYVVLAPSTDEGPLALDGRSDREMTVRLYAVSGYMDDCLRLSEQCRAILSDLVIDQGPVLPQFSAWPMKTENPGDLRWEQVTEYLCHLH